MNTMTHGRIVRDTTVAVQSHRVLVIDADLCLREGLRSRLESRGLKAATAGDAAAAARVLDRDRVDLVVVNTAVLNHRKLIKALTAHDDLPVILLVDAGVVVTGMPQAVDVIRKPFEATSVMRCIEQALDVG